jgi:hypothetical protein
MQIFLHIYPSDFPHLIDRSRSHVSQPVTSTGINDREHGIERDASALSPNLRPPQCRGYTESHAFQVLGIGITQFTSSESCAAFLLKQLIQTPVEDKRGRFHCGTRKL